MMQRLRESLALILIALLPFHAFLVTVLTKVIEGPGHAPMGSIAIWKEVLLAVILLIAIVEIVMSYESRVTRKRYKIDALDGLIIALFFLGTAVTYYSRLSTQDFLFGVRYDFIPLLTFLILRRVDWSELFLKKAMQVLLIVGAIIAGYGIVSYFLPTSFFQWLGYSDLHSLYVPGGPVAPFQQIGGTAIRRIQSVMSGPNQLGLWLLIPIGIVMSHESRVMSGTHISRLLVLMTALVLTFSRAAWIGAAIIIGISLWPIMRKLSRTSVVSLVSCVLCLLVAGAFLFPSILLRAASSRGHLENPVRAIRTMIAHPLGLGLGTAGPASNRTSDACVLLEEGSDPSWASDHPDLCVFVGDVQVQPLDRTCNCPFLPENWYLQIGVEMGWIGLVLYLALVIVVLLRLFKHSSLLAPIFLALSIAALFLHAWEDSAVAYTVWMMMATVLSIRGNRH